MNNLQTIANAIKEQIGFNILMSLGMSDMGYLNDSETTHGGLRFTARIMPMKKDGTRSSWGRAMTVTIELSGSDTYFVRVAYPVKGEPKTHFERSGVYCDQLPALMLALDYDGDTVLNPRLSH